MSLPATLLGACVPPAPLWRSQDEVCKAVVWLADADGIPENGVWRHVALVVDRDDSNSAPILTAPFAARDRR